MFTRCSWNHRITQHGGQRVIIYTLCLFPSAKTKDAIQFKPRCHLLPGKSLGDFFSPPALLTNCRHAFLPHCSSCGYIQTVTSAVCSPNMCTRPVKPNHCVLEGFTMKRAFYNSSFADRNVHSPLVKRAGRIQTNVISVTAGFFFFFAGSLFRRAFVVVCRRGN